MSDDPQEPEPQSPAPPQPERSGISDLPGAVAFAAMGTTIAVCVAVGVLLGIWADRAWGGSPIWLIIGLVLGAVAAVASVVQQVRRFL